MTSAACAIGYPMRPDRISGPTRWSRNSNDVTTPRLPPPPRTPQNRSGSFLALAVTSSPLAVTTSAESRLSMVRPRFRVSQPNPPPSVRPATPGGEVMPRGAGVVVPAAPHGDTQAMLGGEVDATDHVGGAGTADDQRGAPVNHGIPDA